MLTLAKMAFRNISGHRRRSQLLGCAMASLMAVTSLATAFTVGLSDILLNKIIALTNGHVEVIVHEKSDINGNIIRDREGLRKYLLDNVPDLKAVNDVVYVQGRSFGSGAAGDQLIAGYDTSIVRASGITMAVKEGSLKDFLDRQDGALIYQDKAAQLNVKVGDLLHAKFKMVGGQYQTETYRISAILAKENPFLEGILFVNRDRLKKAMGLGPNDATQLMIRLTHPHEAVAKANAIHALLKPAVASLAAELRMGSRSVPVTGYALRSGRPLGIPGLVLLKGKGLQGGIAVSKAVADKLGNTFGKDIELTYPTATGGTKTVKSRVDAVYAFGSDASAGFIYPESLRTLIQNGGERPPSFQGSREAVRPPGADSFFVPDRYLLPRARSAEEIVSNYAKFNQAGWSGEAWDVRSMYETGSQALKLEGAIHLVVLVSAAVMLFFIMIGILNSMLITVRERTRQIGTMRAMGMQASSVRALFLWEASLLAAIACLAGWLAAAAAMFALSLPRLGSQGAWSIFLVDGHIHFLMAPGSILGLAALIIGAAAAGAFFPAQRAARLGPAEAMRTYR